MSRTTILENTEVTFRRILQFEFGTDKPTKHQKFHCGVLLAEMIMDPWLSSTRTWMGGAAFPYLMDYEFNEDKFVEGIDDLILETEQLSTKENPSGPRDAHDLLIEIASDLIRERKPLPVNLSEWSFDILHDTLLDKVEQKRPRPKLRGQHKNANHSRNNAFRAGISGLIQCGFNATRNIKQNGIDYYDCCIEGGSAVDAVGIAYKRRTGERKSYTTIAAYVLKPLVMEI